MSDNLSPNPFLYQEEQGELGNEYLAQLDFPSFDLWITRILFSKLGDMASVTDYLNVYQRRIHSLMDATEMSLDGLCQVLDSLMVEPDRSAWSLKGTSTGYELVPGSKPPGFPVFVDRVARPTRFQDVTGHDVCPVCENTVDVNSNCTACCDELLNKLSVVADVAVPVYFSADCVQFARRLLPATKLRSVDGFFAYVAHVKVRFPAVAMFTKSPDVLLQRITTERRSMLDSYRNLLTSGDLPVFPESVETRGDLVLTEYINKFGIEMGWMVFVSMAGVPWSLIFEAKGAKSLIDKFWGSSTVPVSELYSWLSSAVKSTRDLHGWSMDLSEGSLVADDLLVYRSNFSPHSLELLEEMGFGFILGDSLMTENGYQAFWKDGVLWDDNGARLCYCCFLPVTKPVKLCGSCQQMTDSVSGPLVSIDVPTYVTECSSVSSSTEPSRSGYSSIGDEVPPIREEPVSFVDDAALSAAAGLLSIKHGSHEWHAGTGSSSVGCTCVYGEDKMAEHLANRFVHEHPSFLEGCAVLPMANYESDAVYFPYKAMFDSDSIAVGEVGIDSVDIKVAEVPEVLESVGMSNHSINLLVMTGLMASLKVLVRPYLGVFPAVIVSWRAPIITGYSEDVAWFIVPFDGPITEVHLSCFPRSSVSTRTIGLKALLQNAALRNDLRFPATVFQEVESLVRERDVEGAAFLVKRAFNERFVVGGSNRYYVLEVEYGFSGMIDRQCLVKASKAVEEYVVPVPMEYCHGMFGVSLDSIGKTLTSKYLDLVVAAYRLSVAGKFLDSDGVPTAYYDCLHHLYDEDFCTLL